MFFCLGIFVRSETDGRGTTNNMRVRAVGIPLFAMVGVSNVFLPFFLL
jgi:hypothetical protein